MSIARRLDSPTHASLVTGNHDVVLRPDVTAPYRVTSVRRHHKRVATEQPAVPKPVLPAAPTFPNLAATPTVLAEATQIAPAAEVIVQPARRAPITFSQPSWIIVAAVAAVVGFVVWWVMFERLPDIDPRQIVATNLTAGQEAFDDQRYVEPTERSALHYYTTVLALDPLNTTARNRVDRIADIYIDEAKARLIAGKPADAGLALDRARRARPEHPQLPRLNALLRDELTQILVQARTPATDAQKNQTARDSGQSKPARPAEKRESSVAQLDKQTDKQDVQLPPAKPINLAQLDTARRLIDAPPASTNDLTGTAATLPQAAAGNVDTAGAALPITPQPTAAPPPKVVKFVQPTYPNDALMRGIEGWVDVSLQVAPSGDVIDPRVENSTRGRLFERAALNAVRQWKYEPQAAGASSSTERLQVRVEFRLTD